jgi:hypothetical protein
MGRHKTKTYEQNLARVRNNQRVHRKRVKEYVAELESKIDELKKELQEKETIIRDLEMKLNRGEETVWSCEKMGGERSTGLEIVDDTPITPDVIPIDANGLIASKPDVDILETPGSALDLSTLLPISLPNCPLVNPSCTPEILPLTKHVPQTTPSQYCCATPTPPQSPTYTQTLSLTSRLHLPTPLPFESTTPCSKAYLLIDEQNFRGLDVGYVYSLLVEGFRREQKAGEGCRVENSALFRVLDFISGD